MDSPIVGADAPHGGGNGARLQRIADEFRAGYRLLETIERGVTYFGSSKTTPQEPAYEAARTLARTLAGDGFTAVTGGGPGIMAAANRGAVDGGGRSVGFNIKLRDEQRNPYVGESVSFHYLFVRKVMLASAGHTYVFFPGGLGTLDEFFEISTLIHTNKLHRDVPVVLVGRGYWSPLLDELRVTVVQRYRGFEEDDFRMWTLADGVDDAAAVIRATMSSARLYAPYHGD